MQALGCFGSLLAYEPEAKRCKSCQRQKECKKEVARIRPIALRLLDKFPRVEGGTVGDTWRTPSERKEKREQDARLAAKLVQRAIYDDGEVDALRARINKAANKLLDQAIEDRIDVLRDPIEKIVYLSKPTKAFFQAISDSPKTAKDIASHIQVACDLAAGTSMRHMERNRSLFLGAKRIIETNGMITLA